MSKFSIVKKFSLAFVAPDWKDAYINLRALSVADVKKTFPSLAEVKDVNNNNVSQGLDSILELIQTKFVDGKAFDNGKLVDLEVNDLEELPIMVLSRALSFLSQDATENSTKELGKS